MSEKLVEKLFEYAGKYIVSLEVPPGIGKTYYAVRQALEEASKGRTVIFALPNHQALMTAFAYAVKHYIDMMHRKPLRRLPYLVYYEGIARFCPYLRRDGNKIFKKMLDKLLKKGLIDQLMYDRMKELDIRDVMSIYGSMFVCRYLCPVYKQQKHFEKEKVFVTPNISNQALISKLFTSEVERSRVSNMLSSLNNIRNYVAEIQPEMDEHGKVSGYCLRAVLSKTISKKAQLVTKGALILTPVHALDFITSEVRQRISILQRRRLSIPPPLVVIDEYDFYVYKPVDMPLFMLDQLKEEKEIAKRVFFEERNKRLGGDPSYDWEKVVAALVAYEILSRLEGEANEFLTKYRKEASADLLESPANILVDCVSKPLRIEDGVHPPFSPRTVRLTELKKVLVDIYTELERFNDEFVNNYGASLYDVNAVKSLSVMYFLKLWENILYLIYGKEQRKYRHPALHRDLGGTYRVGYAEIEKPLSIARRFADVLISADALALYYKAVPTDCEVMKNGRKVHEGGSLLLYGVYDYRLFKIFRASDYDIVLMSATGVPWLSNIFATRSYGHGSVVPYYGLRYAASGEITSVFKNVRFYIGSKKEFSYVLLESDNFTKNVLVVTLDQSSLQTYSLHGVIYPVRDLPMMPDTYLKNINYDQYMIALSNCVDPYVLTSLNFMNTVLEGNPSNVGVPSFLVFTQRKDVAVMFTYLLYIRLAQILRTQATVTVCREVVCNDLKDLQLEKLTAVAENSSHFVAYVKTSKGEFRYYITWIRSKMSRGIDLPDDAAAYGVLLVGTPYRPPEAFDIPPKVSQESRSKSTYIEYPLFIEGFDPKNLILLVHNPVDVAEAVNEFIQAVGRALRRAWNISVAHSRIMYRVIISIPWFAQNKIFTYSPLWFQTAFSQ